MEPSEQPPPVSDRLPTRARMALGIGGITDSGGWNAKGHVNAIYNVELGVNPALIGLGTTIVSLWDSIADPIMGYISDNFPTRWGRRRPHILVGAILCGLTFPLIWMVPRSLSESAMFAWFLTTAMLFYAAYTVFCVPYLALCFEASADYHDRTGIMATRYWFHSVSGVMLVWMYPLAKSDLFDDPITGFRWVGTIVGIVLMLAGIVPALFVKERFDHPSGPKAARLPPFRAFWMALSNRTFLALLGAFLISTFAFGMVQSLGMYLNLYYVFGGDTKAGSVLIGLSGSTYWAFLIATTPFIGVLSRRMGKRSMVNLSLVIVAVGSIATWFALDPTRPYLQLAVPAILAPGLITLFTLVNSMVADVCDLDEFQTGQRREAVFGSVMSLIQKTGTSLTYFISNAILVMTGFDVSLEGDQSPRTILLMRALYAALPVIGVIIAACCLSSYTITEKRAHELRVALEARRGGRS